MKVVSRFQRPITCLTLVIASLLSSRQGFGQPNLPTPSSPPPNILLLVADDLGYSDLGSYGGEIRTPSLDRLALEGVRFSDFWVTPRCSSTRAALLTGRWSHEVGVGHLNRNWGLGAYRGRIDPTVPTLAERLRDTGYRTAMVGKWHLAPDPDSTLPTDPDGPLARGFERFWGSLRGSGSHYYPATLFDGDRPLPPTALAGRSYSEAMIDVALKVVEETATDRPFFLYVALTDPHWPLQAAPEEVEAYRGEYLGAAGPEATRRARLGRLIDQGLLPEGTTLPTLEEATDDPPGPLSGPDPWQARRMQAYAAMVERLDRQLGRLIDALRDQGRLENTLVVFLSDNGASAENFNGLWRVVPFFVPGARRTPDGRPVRSGDRAGGEATDDTFEGYGSAWASASNAPFRGHKHQTLEGGIAAPLIVRWPLLPQARRGTIVHDPSHVVDLAPTLLAAAGASPAIARQRGVDLRPAINGSQLPARLLFQEHEGNRAVRSGQWKLVSSWPRGWKLYDLHSDRTERHDLSREHPEIVRELSASWAEWAASVGVRPWPLPVPAFRWTLLMLGTALVLLVLLRLRPRPAARTSESDAPQPAWRK